MNIAEASLTPPPMSETARAMHRKRQWTLILVMAPALVFLLSFYLYPISRMLIMSFFDPELTFEHYLRFIQVPAYLSILINTFEMALGVTLICLVLGYPVAYLLSSLKSPWSGLLMVLIVLPFFTAILVRTYAWMVLLGRNGLLNQALLNLGLIATPLKLMHNMFGTYVGMVHILLPFMILPMYSVMSGIDRDFLRAAESLGANPFRVFVNVFFPLSLPGVGGGCLLVFIIALGFYITPALLGGLSDVMLSMLIEVQVNQMLNWGFASALGVVLLAVTLVVFALYNRFLGIDRLVSSQ